MNGAAGLRGVRHGPGMNAGSTMLVVSRAVGQHLEINHSVDLSIERLNSNGVRLAATAVASQPATPSVVNRLRWL